MVGCVINHVCQWMAVCSIQWVGGKSFKIIITDYVKGNLVSSLVLQFIIYLVATKERSGWFLSWYHRRSTGVAIYTVPPWCNSHIFPCNNQGSFHSPYVRKYFDIQPRFDPVIAFILDGYCITLADCNFHGKWMTPYPHAGHGMYVIYCLSICIHLFLSQSWVIHDLGHIKYSKMLPMTYTTFVFCRENCHALVVTQRNTPWFDLSAWHILVQI